MVTASGKQENDNDGSWCQAFRTVFADERGAEYYLRHDDGLWLTRERPDDAADKRIFRLTRWSNADKTLGSETRHRLQSPRPALVLARGSTTSRP